ncbi:unnamed protein product [Gordionus sp. m RMFG-2023]
MEFETGRALTRDFSLTNGFVLGFDPKRNRFYENQNYLGKDVSKISKAFDLGENELVQLKSEERIKQQASIKNNINNTRFRGTYCVQGLKSISEKDLITHSISNNIKDLLSKSDGRKSLTKPKNRLPIGSTIKRTIKFKSLHTFLRNFATKFIKYCYNPFMANVKNKLARFNSSLESDETRYLWAISFFMEFSRETDLDVKYYSQTLNKDIVHYLINNMHKYIDSLMMDKVDGVIWGKRTHQALMAYKQIIFNLNRLSYSEIEEVREGVKIIKANVFYVPEYRDVLIQLFKSFNPIYYSLDYLKDLIETTHVFIKMLKGYCQEYKNLTVKKRKKSRKISKKTTKIRESKDSALKEKDINLEEISKNWNEQIEIGLSEIIKSYSDIEESINLDKHSKVFDPISPITIEEQKINALYQVYEHLLKSNLEEVVDIFRISRNVWPEDALFGNNNMTIHEEISILKEIYLSDIKKPNNYPASKQPEIVVIEDNDIIDNEQDQLDNSENENYSGEGDEEDEDLYVDVEEQFDFNRFLYNFVNPNIMKCYVLILKNFEENTDFTNHCVVKMLYKVAVDMKIPGMFFQIAVFRIFAQILKFDTTAVNSSITKGTNRFQDLIDFAKHIIKLFVRVTKKNKLAFVDLLFWKNVKDSIEIFNCYGVHDCDDDLTKLGTGTDLTHPKNRQTWTDEQDFELETLYNEFNNKKVDAGARDVSNDNEIGYEDDIVEYIRKNLIDDTKTGRQIILRCKKLGLILPSKSRTKSLKRLGKFSDDSEKMIEEDHSNSGEKCKELKSTSWNEEDEEILISSHVMSQAKNSSVQETVDMICEALNFRYKKREISRKLLQFGLLNLNDANDLRKKRTKRKISRKLEPILPPLNLFRDDLYDNETLVQNDIPPKSKLQKNDTIELSDLESQMSLEIDMSVLNSNEESNRKSIYFTRPVTPENLQSQSTSDSDSQKNENLIIQDDSPDEENGNYMPKDITPLVTPENSQSQPISNIESKTENLIIQNDSYEHTVSQYNVSNANDRMLADNANQFKEKTVNSNSRITKDTNKNVKRRLAIISSDED